MRDSYLTNDARGASFSRIVNNTVDKGAFESLLNAGISGCILISSGRGTANATVTLTNQTGEIRYARTNSFGYYRLIEVPVGRVYTVHASAKGYQFAEQSLEVVNQMGDVNFQP